jgi:hypothetical protein
MRDALAVDARDGDVARIVDCCAVFGQERARGAGDGGGQGVTERRTRLPALVVLTPTT